ncbi:hypothetical protein C8Q74DRAFT_1373875 [Fomes fomentarius]|nr:hypothetical protein C8Q74DRAFT_1373875 [Fomes fomentarius]
MGPNASEEIDRLKSHLQFYEGLVKDQAAQIASLKAEVAYLKTRTRRQKTTQDGLAELEVAQPLQAADPPTPPPKTPVGTSDHPFVVDDDSDKEQQNAAPNKAHVRRQETPSPRNLKRDSSSGPNDFSHVIPALDGGYQWFEPKDDDSPRKKPKLISLPDVEVSRLTHQLQAYLVPQTPNQTEDIGQAGPSDTRYMSPLSSVLSTPSRPGSPVEYQDHNEADESSPALDALIRSASRELSYLDDAPSQQLPPPSSAYGIPVAEAEPFKRPDRTLVRRNAYSTRFETDRGYQDLYPPARTPAGPQACSSSYPASQQENRLADATHYAINISDLDLLTVVVNRKQMAKIFGGKSIDMCVQTAGRNFIYPKVRMNPLLPRRPGEPGLLYRATREPGWKGDVQTLFISERDGEYRYCGQYKITLSSSLSTDEYNALSDEVKREWAKYIATKAKYRHLCERVIARLGEDEREALDEEAAMQLHAKEVALSAGMKYRPKASDREVSVIMAAYRKGEEKLRTWRMECVGFDEAFMKELVSKL